MIRLIAFLGGLSGAVGLSQFPEFSQQYLQRLGGAVDGLRPAVVEFDANAKTSGISREQALEQYAEAGGFLAEQGAVKEQEIKRYEELESDYTALKQAQPLQRLAQVYRFTDTNLARSTWADFRPAVPATIDGFICAAIGYALFWGMIMLLISLVVRLFRRRRSVDVT